MCYILISEENLFRQTFWIFHNIEWQMLLFVYYIHCISWWDSLQLSLNNMTYSKHIRGNNAYKILRYTAIEIIPECIRYPKSWPSYCLLHYGRIGWPHAGIIAKYLSVCDVAVESMAVHVACSGDGIFLALVPGTKAPGWKHPRNAAAADACMRGCQSRVRWRDPSEVGHCDVEPGSCTLSRWLRHGTEASYCLWCITPLIFLCRTKNQDVEMKYSYLQPIFAWKMYLFCQDVEWISTNF